MALPKFEEAFVEKNPAGMRVPLLCLRADSKKVHVSNLTDRDVWPQCGNHSPGINYFFLEAEDFLNQSSLVACGRCQYLLEQHLKFSDRKSYLQLMQDLPVRLWQLFGQSLSQVRLQEFYLRTFPQNHLMLQLRFRETMVNVYTEEFDEFYQWSKDAGEIVTSDVVGTAELKRNGQTVTILSEQNLQEQTLEDVTWEIFLGYAADLFYRRYQNLEA